MKLKILFLFAILTCITFQLSAQAESFGMWSSIGVEKQMNKWNLSADTEFRTIYYVRLIDRWSIGLNADYGVMKQLKIGFGYQFMNSLDYDTDYSKYYFIRNRFYVSGSWRLKLNNFTFKLRERIQLTQKENRIQTDGKIDAYNSNPDLAWRNRLQLSYNIPYSKITPSFSFESFYELNNPVGNSFDNLRYMLMIDYKLNKRNNVEVYGLINSAQNSDDASGKYILGLSYTHSF